MTVLVEKRFRANPRYELHLRERPVDQAGAPLATPPSDEPVYGYLLPQPSSPLAFRAVSPDTALLFLTLRCEGPLPDYFRSHFGSRMERLLSRLVLDGVLEVEHAGTFISGSHARQVLFGDPAYSGGGPIAKLSVEAVQYGEALGDMALPELAGRLYGFGRWPPTPAQKRMLRHSDLGDDGWGPISARPALGQYWALAYINEHWIMWRPLGMQSNGEPAKFKLYVSPGFSHAAEAFAAAAEVLGQSAGVRGLKLGRGLAGLTRPDKLVAYFSRLDDLHEAGLNLYRLLEGCPVHGVPFSAELSPDGLLSWGADRPRTAGGKSESWRYWISSRLAAHLETARKSMASGALWPFALDRLRLDGVDPALWAPNDEFWLSIAAQT